MLPPATSGFGWTASAIKYRSSRRFRSRHRPRCQGIAPCSRSSIVRAKVSPPSDSVRRSVSTAFVRRNACAPKFVGLRPMLATQSGTSRAYCRVVCPPRSPRPATRNMPRFSAGHPDVVVDRLLHLFGDLEPNGPAGLLLSDRRPIQRVAAWCCGIDAHGDIPAVPVGPLPARLEPDPASGTAKGTKTNQRLRPLIDPPQRSAQRLLTVD